MRGDDLIHRALPNPPSAFRAEAIPQRELPHSPFFLNRRPHSKFEKSGDESDSTIICCRLCIVGEVKSVDATARPGLPVL